MPVTQAIKFTRHLDEQFLMGFSADEQLSCNTGVLLLIGFNFCQCSILKSRGALLPLISRLNFQAASGLHNQSGTRACGVI